jgi:hypothetical protein
MLMMWTGLIRDLILLELRDMSKILIAALLAGTALGASSATAANLVTNGAFTSSSYASNSEFGASYGGQGVTGWTGNNGYDLYFTSPTAATTVNAAGQYSYTGNEKLWAATASPVSGGAFVALDGAQEAGVQGSISQTINGLVAGQSYLLTFDAGAGQLQSRTGATTEQLQVSLGSQTFLTPVASNASEGFTGWFSLAYTFTATSASEVLSFLSIGTPSGLPPIATLDDVSLTAATPVPEPLSLALLGAGVLSLGLVRRARKS